ncbi:MAG: CBS domain-containing protein [Acidimicrobiia bacterium]|nr:CBS domain-containing protein [Acidimicrobiia bacterium]
MAPLVDSQPVTPRDSIGELVSGGSVTVDEKLTLRSIAAVLSAADVGAALVHRDNRPVGIVSERDVIRALADEADPETVWSADVMTQDLVTADAGEEILRVAFRMIDESIRHLAVTQDGQVIGVVSSRDVFAVLAEDVRETW